MLKVKYRNLSAHIPKEAHSCFVDGEAHDYEFEFNKYTEMLNADHGRAFAAADSAFEVVDENGNIIVPQIASAESGDFILKPGEVVADLRELTNAALAERCRRIAGGEGFSKASKKDDLINFLFTHNENAPIDDDIDDFDDEEFNESDGEVGSEDDDT